MRTVVFDLDGTLVETAPGRRVACWLHPAPALAAA